MSSTSADQSDSVNSLAAILDHAESLPSAIALRSRTYELLDAPPEAAVVDIGGGTGRAVAEMTAAGMRAVGIDGDPAMLAIARARWPQATFHLGDANQLDIDDGAMQTTAPTRFCTN